MSDTESKTGGPPGQLAFFAGAARDTVAAWVTGGIGQSVMVSHGGQVVACGILERGDERAIAIRDGEASVLVVITEGMVVRTLPGHE